MIGVINQWVIRVICASLVVAIGDSLTPKGSVKQVVRLIGGLILLVVVVNPLLKLDAEQLVWDTGFDGVELMDLEQVNSALMKTIIGDEVGAYIQDKAEELGGKCLRVEVMCEYLDNSLWSPSSVTVWGVFSEQQQSQLMESVAQELGIPKDRQSVIVTEEEL